MANLTITAANMIPVAGFGYEGTYLAGATVTRGAAIYLDTGATPPSWKLADANGTALLAGSGGVAISLSDSVSGQPVVAMTSGDLGFGAILTKGEVYIVSATAGSICLHSDAATNDYITILGVASSTSNLKVRPWATGIQEP